MEWNLSLNAAIAASIDPKRIARTGRPGSDEEVVPVAVGGGVIPGTPVAPSNDWNGLGATLGWLVAPPTDWTGVG